MNPIPLFAALLLAACHPPYPDSGDSADSGSAPEVVIESPIDGGLYWSEVPLDLRITVTDADDDLEQVTVTADGTDLTKQLEATDESWKGEVRPVQGTHELAVSASDRMGHSTDISTVFEVQSCQGVPSSGCRWTFDGMSGSTVQDDSGQACNGTAYASGGEEVELESDAGVYRDGLALGGQATWLQAGLAGAAGGEDEVFAAMFWLKRSDFSVGEGTILQLQSADGSSSISLSTAGVTDALGSTVVAHPLKSLSAALADQDWHHLLLALHGQCLDLFLDGARLGEECLGLSAAASYDGSVLRLGADAELSSPLTATFDDLALFQQVPGERLAQDVSQASGPFCVGNQEGR